MADFEKKVTLIEIEIDQGAAISDVDKLSSAIIEQKKAVKENNEEIKELNKTNSNLTKEVKAGTVTQDEASKQIKENSEKVTELTKKNLNLGDGIKDLNKERGQAVKVSKLQSNSLEALRNKTANQKKELNGLNTSTKEGAKRFEELTKELKGNNSEIVKADQAAGDYKTSIGDYAGQLGIVQKLTDVQTKAQGFLNAVVNSGTKATTFSSKAMKVFKIALASTGVGLLVIALGSLVSFLTSTQEGMDKVTAVTRPLTAIFEKIKGVVQELGGSVFAGLAKIMNGDIKEGLKTLGQGFTDSIGNVKNAITEGVEAGTKLDQITKQIEKSEIALTTSRAALNTEFKKSKEIAEDVTKSEQERLAAAERAIATQNQLLEEEQSLINLKIEKMKLEQSFNDSSREDLQELAELEAEKLQFEAAAAGKRTGINNFLNSLKAKIASEELGRIKTVQDAETKAREEKEAADKLALDKENEQAAIKLENKRSLDAKLLELDSFRREQENERELEAVESEQEKFELMAEQQAERFEIEQEVLAEQREIALENKALSDEEILTVQADFDLQKEEMKAANEDALKAIDIDAKKADSKRQDKKNKGDLAKAQKKSKSINAIIMQGLATIKGASDSFFAVKNNTNDIQNKKETNDLIRQLNSGQITREEFDRKKENLDKASSRKAFELKKKEFIANKVINIAETVMNTAKGVMGAVSSIPGPVGIALGVLVGILGAVQIAAIASEPTPSTPSFASGGDVFGFTVGGKSHSQGGTKYTGEDGNTFEVERDEGIFVTKREATNPALRMLSGVNESYGGSSMFSTPRAHLQEGGVAQSNSLSGQDVADIVAETVANQPPPVVMVSSIMGGINAEVDAEGVGVI